MFNWCLKVVLALGLLAAPAVAQRAVMEGVPSTRYAIKVDTANGRVDIATTTYSWGIANVGLHVASNVVVDSTGTRNACVIYATGSISCLGVTLGGVPKISSGSSVMFLSTFNFTSSETSFTPAATVTGSTISFTVSGTTVACRLSGAALASSGGDVIPGIAVDNNVNAIPGCSSTVGITDAYSGNANFKVNLTSGVEFQVTAGTHTFRLGLWNVGATPTITFPATTSVATFGCWEVPYR